MGIVVDSAGFGYICGYWASPTLTFSPLPTLTTTFGEVGFFTKVYGYIPPPTSAPTQVSLLAESVRGVASG